MHQQDPSINNYASYNWHFNDKHTKHPDPIPPSIQGREGWNLEGSTIIHGKHEAYVKAMDIDG